MKHPSSVAVLQALLAAVLFGISTPLSKWLLGELAPIPLAAMLYLGAGMGAWLLFALQVPRRHGRDLEARLSRADLPWLAGALLAGGVGAPILLLLGLDRTPASTAALLLNFEAAATMLIAALVFKEAVDRRIFWAVGLITLASILLTWEGTAWGISLGGLGILGACFLWGLDNTLTRHISAKNPLLIVGVKGLGAGFFSLVLAIFLGETLPAAGLIGLSLLVGAVCYGLSIQLFILALRGLGAARTGALFGIAPFVGASLSLIFFRETPRGLFWAALPVMLLGAWLMITEKHLHYHDHELLEHIHAHRHPDDHHDHAHLPGEALENGGHAHFHSHANLAHSHPHTPDLHHRHGHERGMRDGKRE